MAAPIRAGVLIQFMQNNGAHMYQGVVRCQIIDQTWRLISEVVHARANIRKRKKIATILQLHI